MELAVQTGGWMSSDSPFCRAGLCPDDTHWGAYEPMLYPDTAFPALDGETIMRTERSGRLRGFRIPDPPGTGRSALMIHDSARFGSEGCISTQDVQGWEKFCVFMQEINARGVESIPLHVTYACDAPNPNRFPQVRPSCS